MLPERHRNFLLALFAIAVVLGAYTVAPFVGAMFAAVVLACALDPWQQRLTQRLRRRPYVAAGLLSIGVLLTMVVPLGVTSALAVRDGRRILEWTQQQIRAKGLDAFVEPLPDWVETPAKRGIAMLPGDGIEEAIKETQRRHP
jgi:predicted PurR-regulated permease PerM